MTETSDRKAHLVSEVFRWRLLQYTQLFRPGDRLRAPFNPELAVDMAGMGFHRVQRNKQLIADLLIRATLGDQSQDGHFPRTELFRCGGRLRGTGCHCWKLF